MSPQVSPLGEHQKFRRTVGPFLLSSGCRLVSAWEALGLQSWELAYWIRFLNPAAYVVLVWISYRLVRKVYPDRIFLWLGVPALLAVFPQDVYFGINREVLSAPMTAVALLLMVKAVDEKESKSWLLLASVLVGLTFLVDVSNCVLYGAFALTLWSWARQSSAKPRSKARVVVGTGFVSYCFPLHGCSAITW